jgi:hypothetical protein
MYRKLLEKGWAAVLLAFLAATVALACFLPRFGVEAGTNVLLNEDDQDLAYYNITRADWGYDEYVILSVRRADWFTPESIQLLSEFVADLEKAPHVKKDGVTSILKVPLLRNRASLLPMPTFLAQPNVDLAKARGELLEHTQARGNLISTDGRDLSVLVYLDVPEPILRLEPDWSRAQGEKKLARSRESVEAAEATLARIGPEYKVALAEHTARRNAMVRGLREVAGRWGPPKTDEAVKLAGTPIVYMNIIEHVTDDLRVFGVASFAFFTLAFLAIYRKVRWTALPILACLLPVVLIVGTMSAADKKITVITSNLPVLLFVLMLPYTVYIIERYRERRTLFPDESGLDSTMGAVRENWWPCLYSCTTTQAGFASLLTSGINPVRTFGLMMTIGMGVGLACVFLFMPAATRPLRAIAVTGAGTASEPAGVVRWMERLVLRAPAFVAVLGAAVLGVSIWGTTKIKVETKFIDYFKPNSEVYQGLLQIDTRMGGITPLEVLLTSKEPGFFKSPAGLEAIAAASTYFDGVPETGNVRSLKTFMDEVRKAYPKMTVEALAKVLKQMKAESQLREFVNADYTVTRVLVRFKETAPTLHRNNIIRGLREHLAKEPALQELSPRPTGVFLLYANMLNSLIESQKDTFLMVVGAIYAMLILLFRAPLLSLVVLVPQVLPALACLGAMGLAGVPLDLVTVMIASIAMGVGIDAAIQYTVRYRIELAATKGDYRAAVTRSHATIGRAIWIATSIVVAGFIVLVLSKFVPTVYFGIFTALAMLMGQFAALTLLPALFLLFKQPRYQAGP